MLLLGRACVGLIPQVQVVKVHHSQSLPGFWTGLAMSPAIASAFPATVTVLGGQQSARTIHFFVSVFLLLFLLVHVGMVGLTGFRNRMRAMITGRPPRPNPAINPTVKMEAR